MSISPSKSLAIKFSLRSDYPVLEILSGNQMKLDVQEEIHDQFCSYNPAFSPSYNPLDHTCGYQDEEYCLQNCQTRFTYYCEKCGNAIHYQCFNKDVNAFMVPHECDKCIPIFKNSEEEKPHSFEFINYFNMFHCFPLKFNYLINIITLYGKISAVRGWLALIISEDTFLSGTETKEISLYGLIKYRRNWFVARI